MSRSASSPKIRPAAVAGRFYPRQPAELRSEVERLLTNAAGANIGQAKALIAPHAGYIYSGTVAAHAFAALKSHADAISRVVLIGPAHYVHLSGVAAPATAAFETPLGRVRIDRDALHDVAGLAFVAATDAPHASEHALEVELPFLQVLVRDFALVPLLVGDARPQEVAELLARLWGGPETVIVVSSDLSHFLSYGEAQLLDRKTASMIEQGDWAGLGPANACGFLAIAGMLIEAERRGLAARRLALCNSGDTAGPRDSVVGYGAWAFSEPTITAGS